MRLGRLPHSPAAVAAAPRHRFAATPPPSRLDRSGVPFQPGLYRNNTLPDCSAVGLANAAGAVAALAGYTLAIGPDTVPAFYGESVGHAGATEAELEATDGAVLLDVLTYQVKHGFDIGSDRLVGLFGALPLTRTALANAMARLGHAYVGVMLHDADMALPPVWTPGRDGAEVGGHCVTLWDYTGLHDDDTVRIGTWGQWQPATWTWIEARIEEAWGLVWRQLGPADGSVDVAVLEAALGVA